MEKRPALGKGLSALIPDAPEPRASPLEVDIDRLSPNTFQPRAPIDDARLDDLARSIKSNGVIQPIVVRKVGDRFQIIAGERRWRAAQKAGLLRVPVVVRDVAAGAGAVAARDGADREHPARESESDRRGARVSPADRRFPADAGRHRRGGRQGPRDGRQLPAAAQAAGRSARRGGGRHAVDGPCARAAGADRRKPTSAGWRATSSPAACRSARPSRSSRKIAEAARARAEEAPPPSRRTSTPAPPRIACARSSAPASASSGRAAAGRIEIDFASEEELIRHLRPADRRAVSSYSRASGVRGRV